MLVKLVVISYRMVSCNKYEQVNYLLSVCLSLNQAKWKKELKCLSGQSVKYDGHPDY